MNKMNNTDKTVYILGAGSSISHTNNKSPTIEDIFIFGKKIARSFDIYKQYSDRYKDLGKYIFDFFGLDMFTVYNKINVEDILTSITISIEKYPNPLVYKIRNDLLDLINFVLTNINESLTGDYYTFKNQLKKNDSIISFNWDLLLDNILGRLLIWIDNTDDKTNSLYHNMFFNRFAAEPEYYLGNMGNSPPEREINKGQSVYLKLHGSIDWQYCNKEMCRGKNKLFPVFLPKAKHYCSYCYALTQRLVIPPLLNKQFDKYPAIGALWNIAAKELQFAKRVVIWGYSLPKTDFYSDWIIRQARIGDIKELVIINPSVIRESRTGENINYPFVRKFYSIFRKIIEKEDCKLYTSHKDFIKKQDVFAKFPLLDKNNYLNLL